MYLLHTSLDRFVLEVDHSVSNGVFGLVDGSSASTNQHASISIDRRSGAITRSQTRQPQAQAAAYPERIDGIMGIIHLLRGRYLILITSSKHVATVQGCPIRQVLDTKILPYAVDKHSSSSPVQLTKDQERDEREYLSMVQQVLRCGFFYFSYEYDLTLTTQRIADIRVDATQSALPLWQRADARFWWNKFLCSDLIDSQAHEFILPVMNGYVFQQHQRIHQQDVTFVLISRRAHLRTGKRFVTRGLDEEGNAANFAEAEQIIFVTGADINSTHVASYVQTRGSIPVLWEQPVTLKYTPKIHFQHNNTPVDLKDDSQRKRFEQATTDACRKHFEAQVKIYGKQVCLNLVNQKGAELALVKAFKHNVDTMARADVRLVNWDFHQECRKMKYENIGKLFDLVKDDVDAMGWFVARVSSSPSTAGSSRVGGVEWEVLRRQTGTLRTNCIDCLDRTNVVQSVFARRILDRQLSELTGFQAGVDQHEQLDNMFRHVWANNADAMSLQYSGTGALKTDFTRTGKRSLRGACMDGVNSMTRYYLNNFKDGRHQDALDLFLGVYRPSVHAPSPFRAAKSRSHPAHQKSLLGFACALTLVLTLMVATFEHVTPPSMHPHKNWSWTTQITAFVAVDFFVGMKLIQRYGKDYANKPLFRSHLDKA